MPSTKRIIQIEPTILRETPWWLAVDKPAGLVTDRQWNYPSVEGWVKDYLLAQGITKPYVGLVHRLDRLTSGIVLVAKRKRALQLLQEQFRERTVQKQYRATVEGQLSAPSAPSALLEHYLLVDKHQKKAIISTRPLPGAKLVQLRYTVLATTEHQSELEIDLLTGKYHQIRAQLSAIGHPVVGDVTYGATTIYSAHAIALRATRLVFTDPQTEEQIVIM